MTFTAGPLRRWEGAFFLRFGRSAMAMQSFEVVADSVFRTDQVEMDLVFGFTAGNTRDRGQAAYYDNGNLPRDYCYL